MFFFLMKLCWSDRKCHIRKAPIYGSANYELAFNSVNAGQFGVVSVRIGKIPARDTIHEVFTFLMKSVAIYMIREYLYFL